MRSPLPWARTTSPEMPPGPKSSMWAAPKKTVAFSYELSAA